MVEDIEFAKLADRFMEQVFTRLEDEDPDELDADLAMGVLSIEFGDGTRCIMNRQTAAHQIWLAHGASAWHFAHDGSDWLDTKGRGRLIDVLSQVLSNKLQRPIRL